MDIIDAVSKRVTGMDKSIQCKYRSYYCDSDINKVPGQSKVFLWNMSCKTSDLS
ncbi:hypothetical protein YSA_01672 [Pseudomonas putida ND6]|uniref:Uncharacterized protein n=1 Tax=Pseudomonas putida ND6 TaxID=231023 RepID=I3UQB3_PSEPU|nr:hypothetical protein YSA_01672 [Pseudomonas putida ND6]